MSIHYTRPFIIIVWTKMLSVCHNIYHNYIYILFEVYARKYPFAGDMRYLNIYDKHVHSPSDV